MLDNMYDTNLQNSTIMDEKTFLNSFAEALEMDDASVLTRETEFQNLDEWDSMAYLSVIAMLDDQYGVQIENSEFVKFITLGELMDYIANNK